MSSMFGDLEPPPHGVLKLRARIATEEARARSRRARVAALVLGPAAATAAIVALVVNAGAPHVTFDHPALAHMTGVEVTVDGARIPAVVVSDGVYLVP
jgi:hypothetical protein